VKLEYLNYRLEIVKYGRGQGNFREDRNLSCKCRITDFFREKNLSRKSNARREKGSELKGEVRCLSNWKSGESKILKILLVKRIHFLRQLRGKK